MKRVFSFLTVVLILASTISCSRGPDGYAVLLWPDTDSSLEAGRVLEVIDDSAIGNSIRVTSNDEEFLVETWRVIQFDDYEVATAYAEEYAPWTDAYGRSLRTALPVREQPDRTSTRMYRLRDGELMKIIGRLEEESDEAGLIDYWYHVLTREGLTGWVFGYYMELTGAAGRSLDPAEEFDNTDRIVRDIAATIWRPDYFPRMVSSGRIALDEFSPRFGFFGDPANQRFRLVLPEIERTFDYVDYYSDEDRVITFEGTDLTVTLTSPERIEVGYLENGRRRNADFVLFEEEIPVIIEAERERREALFEELYNRGSTLVSTAYGTMELTDRGAITWTGYERLVPAVLPTGFNGSGRFEFALHLADDLLGRYDGALELINAASPVVFLYSFTDDGVRFVYVPSRLVDESNIVTDEPISPIVIFFRFTDR
ncbi:MAG: SH3 domain-containing protein [Alkalispirochaeta sp.]